MRSMKAMAVVLGLSATLAVGLGVIGGSSAKADSLGIRDYNGHFGFSLNLGTPPYYYYGPGYYAPYYYPYYGPTYIYPDYDYRHDRDDDWRWRGDNRHFHRNFDRDRDRDRDHDNDYDSGRWHNRR